MFVSAIVAVLGFFLLKRKKLNN
ncbi:hypothetical protein [uncultured Catenibacterium sp.]